MKCHYLQVGQLEEVGAREEGKVGGNRTIVITMATSSNSSNSNTTPDEIYMKTFQSLTQNVQMLPYYYKKTFKIMS